MSLISVRKDPLDRKKRSRRRTVTRPLWHLPTKDYRSAVPDQPQRAARSRSLVLILAKDLASRLATPVFVVDAEGELLYFNEAAEGVLGRDYADFGESKADEWAAAFKPTDEEGNILPMEELPVGIAFMQRRPAHRTLRIQAGDGQQRDLAVTAFPLFAHPDEFVGAFAVFWERTDTDGG
jgi:PAS domain-containing protein